MALYYGMTTLMDKNIGRILDKLDELGLAENTLVVFTSDHGHFLGQHGLWAKGPFHYEDLVRVPFLVRHPHQTQRGAQSDALQSLVDLAPSFLEFAGAPVPGAMQGVSQNAVWRGETEAVREAALVEFQHQPTKLHLQTLVTPTHKLTIYRGASYGEIYDLQHDPNERHNLWDDVALRGRLLEEMAQADLARQTPPVPRIAHA